VAASKNLGTSNEPDHVSTKVVSHTFEYDGLKFSWWALNEAPALVTVSSQWFGSKSGFANKDPEAMARQLAGQIVTEYKAKADEVKKLLKAREDRRNVQ